MARLGLHPRLARALLDGAREVGARRAAEVVALLSEEPPREYGDDLAAAWRTARRGGDGVRGALAAGGAAAGVALAVRHPASSAEPGLRGRHRRGPAAPAGARADDAVAGLVAALAFPERVARARGEGAFLMASGTGARARRRVAAAQRARGWPSPSRTGPRTPPPRGCGSPPSSTRTRRVRPPRICSSPARRSAGRTAMSSPGEVERLGAVELSVRAAEGPGPRSRTGGAARRAAARGARAAALDAARRRGCASGSPFCTGSWARPGRMCRTRALLDRTEEWLEPELSRARRRADLGRIHGRPGAAAAAAVGDAATRPGSTSWRRSGSRCRAARGSGWSTAGRSRSWR